MVVYKATLSGGNMVTKKLLTELAIYLDNRLGPVSIKYNSCTMSDKSADIEKYIINKQKSFRDILFDFIDNKGLSDPDIYKRANIDRRLFSKIRSNPDYHISKNTAIALALALELERNDFDTLLNAAGYSLSDSDTFDLIIQFFIEKGLYNLYDINLALSHFKLKPLL
jgi:hypothetical protein